MPEHKVAAIPHPEWKQSPRYALFSAGGFDPLLEQVARSEGVLLIGARELFCVDTGKGPLL